MITNNPQGGNLNFKLCGNAFFHTSAGSSIGGGDLYAQVYVANCSQFYDGTGTTAGIVWETSPTVPDPVSTTISAWGTVCFDFPWEFNIGATCEYHAAVGLFATSDYVGNDSILDFSFQLRVTQ
jgi:hypothetical protein